MKREVLMAQCDAWAADSKDSSKLSTSGRQSAETLAMFGLNPEAGGHQPTVHAAENVKAALAKLQ